MDRRFYAYRPNVPVARRRRNLPHWEQPGATYFITIRLADSLPLKAQRVLEAERQIWSRARPGLSAREWARVRWLFSEKVDSWLDRGYGSCLLQKPKNATAVANALAYFDGSRYVLDRYAIMPNHLHVLGKPLGEYDLSSILHSWKSFTAHQFVAAGANPPIWRHENFDHIVRTRESLERFRSYIDANPEKAGLQEGQYLLGQGIGLV